MNVVIKTPEQIAKMREAGKLAAEVLEMIGEHVKAGVTTEELDRIRAFFAAPDYETGLPEEIDRSDPAFALWVDRQVAAHKGPGYAIVNISLKPLTGIPGDASAEQMALVADLAERYSLNEIRVTHAQNLVLPHVRKADLHAIWQQLEEAGLAEANLDLITDIIACPGLDYCALANARSIPLAQKIAQRFADADRHAIVTNGPPSIDTNAVPAEGGYRLSGHWDFSSGSSHSTWLAARAPVEGREGQAREPRMFLVPKSDATVLDTWQVNGLRGTASFSFEVDDVFVPESHTYLESDAPRDDSPIFVIPKIPLFSIGFATISVALARRCLDDAIELAGRKTQRGVSGAMIDRSTVHRQIGETEAGLRAADQYLRSSAAALWESAREHGKVEMDARIEVRMASTHAIRHAAEVVDSAYELFGSGAIFKTNRIQRHYQDVHTIAQQIQGRATNFETAGRYFLGLEPGGML